MIIIFRLKHVTAASCLDAADKQVGGVFTNTCDSKGKSSLTDNVTTQHRGCCVTAVLCKH